MRAKRLSPPFSSAFSGVLDCSLPTGSRRGRKKIRETEEFGERSDRVRAITSYWHEDFTSTYRIFSFCHSNSDNFLLSSGKAKERKQRQRLVRSSNTSKRSQHTSKARKSSLVSWEKTCRITTSRVVQNAKWIERHLTLKMCMIFFNMKRKIMMAESTCSTFPPWFPWLARYFFSRFYFAPPPPPPFPRPFQKYNIKGMSQPNRRCGLRPLDSLGNLGNQTVPFFNSRSLKLARQRFGYTIAIEY